MVAAVVAVIGAVVGAVVAAVDEIVGKFLWAPSGAGEELKYIDLKREEQNVLTQSYVLANGLPKCGCGGPPMAICASSLNRTGVCVLAFKLCYMGYNCT